MLDDELCAKTLGNASGMGLIAVGFSAAKVKIAVGGHTIVAQASQSRQQSHRVGST